MTIKHQAVDSWSLAIEWIVANLGGWLAGLAIGLYLITLLAGLIPSVSVDRLLSYIVALSVAVTTGVAQQWVLRHRLPSAGRWATATILGYLLLMLVALVFQSGLAATNLWSNALLLALLGLSVGLPQWLLLRKQFSGAEVWLPASAASLLGWLWLIANPAGSKTAFVLLGAALGAVGAVVPGIALAWLARQSVETA